MKTPKMRGQAFIVFNDTSCAVNAVRELQNFQLLNKPMVSGAYLSHIFHYGQNNESQHLSFSKSKSHATLRAEGQEVALNKEKRRLEKEGQLIACLRCYQIRSAAEKANKRTRPGDKDKAPPEPAPAPAAPPPPLPAVPPPPPEAGEPNKILFVQNLPADRTEESLSEVFSKSASASASLPSHRAPCRSWRLVLTQRLFYLPAGFRGSRRYVWCPARWTSRSSSSPTSAAQASLSRHCRATTSTGSPCLLPLRASEGFPHAQCRFRIHPRMSNQRESACSEHPCTNHRLLFLHAAALLFFLLASASFLGVPMRCNQIARTASRSSCSAVALVAVCSIVLRSGFSLVLPPPHTQYETTGRLLERQFSK